MGSSLSTTTGCSSSQMPTGECPALPCAYALVLFCSRSVLTDSDSGACPQNARQDVSIQGLMCTPILDV